MYDAERERSPTKSAKNSMVAWAVIATIALIPCLVLAPHVSGVPLLMLAAPLLLPAIVMSYGEVAALVVIIVGTPVLYASYAFLACGQLARDRRMSMIAALLAFHLASVVLVGLWKGP